MTLEEAIAFVMIYGSLDFKASPRTVQLLARANEVIEAAADRVYREFR